MNEKCTEPTKASLPRGAALFIPNNGQSLAQNERYLSQEEAWVRLQKDVESLGLKLRLRECGRKLPTVRCDLFNSIGEKVDSGLGKGLELQCSLSAGFEALEHALSTAHSDLYQSAIAVPIRSLSSLLSRWNSPQIKNLQTKLPEDAEISCLPFYDLLRENEPALVPEFLVNVDRMPGGPARNQTTRLPPLGTNNGSAIGTCFEEALLHALCELIERDALALFLLATFVKEKPERVRVVDRVTLPAGLRELVAKIEAETGHTVIIWDMTSDIGIPAYGSAIQVYDRVVPPLGCGVSLHSGYAVERALTEALQDYHMWDKQMEQENESRLTRLDPWPALQACAACAVHKLPEERMLAVEFRDSAVESGDNVHLQVDHLLNLLRTLGFTVLCAIHKKLASGTTCLRVVIPEFEAFHLVRAGVPVLPGPRGRRVLQKS